MGSSCEASFPGNPWVQRNGDLSSRSSSLCTRLPESSFHFQPLFLIIKGLEVTARALAPKAQWPMISCPQRAMLSNGAITSTPRADWGLGALYRICGLWGQHCLRELRFDLLRTFRVYASQRKMVRGQAQPWDSVCKGLRDQRSHYEM